MKFSIRAGAPSGAPRFVFHRLAVLVAVAAMLLAAPKPARAGRLGTDIIALFPKEVGEFAYADLKKARTMKWFPQLLYAFGTGSGPNDLFFLFIDSSTAAFGHRSVLEKMVEVRFGTEEGLLRNDNFFPLISEANGSGVVWAVLNPAYTRLAVQQLAPEVQQFPEAAKLIARMQNMLINISAGSGIDGKFQAVCGSTEDANTLAQLLQAGFLYKRYQAGKDNPELADMLDQARVTPSGDRVILNMALTDDQMSSLIRHNTFALKM